MTMSIIYCAFVKIKNKNFQEEKNIDFTAL